MFSLLIRCITRSAHISCGNSTLASAHTRLLSVGREGSLWGGFDGRIKDVMSYVTVITTQCVSHLWLEIWDDVHIYWHDTCNASSYQKCMWNQFPDRNTVNRQLTLMWIPRMGRQSWGTVLLRYLLREEYKKSFIFVGNFQLKGESWKMDAVKGESWRDLPRPSLEFR